jgi:hypothetical protein
MTFAVAGATRSGAVSVRSGSKADPKDENFNVDPGDNIYRPVQRRLTRSAGTGLISAQLVTSSEFTRFADNKCEGVAFKSEGTIGLPNDLSGVALGVVEDNIRMGLRFEKGMKVRLQATVLADLDIVEIELLGPQFTKAPLRINDAYNKVLDIAEPGIYTLKGSYQLVVKLPNAGLGGREIKVEMRATLSGA